MKITSLLMLALLITSLIIPGELQAGDNDLKKANQRAMRAAEVFREVMDRPDRAIPQEIIDRAEVIAVFPSVLKVGFVFGGKQSYGVVSIRDPKTLRWQPPLFVKLREDRDLKTDLGGVKVDLILVGMTRVVANLFTEDKFMVGQEITASPGPVGQQLDPLEYDNLRTDLLSYTRTQSLFNGSVFTGTIVREDEDINDEIYGVDDYEDIYRQISEKNRPIPVNAFIFPHTLTEFSSDRGVFTKP